LRLDRVVNTGEGLIFRLRHVLAIPSVNFHMMMSKWSFAFSTLIGFSAQVALVTLVAMLIAGLVNLAGGEMPGDIAGLLEAAISSRVYQAVILILALINGRNVLVRMDDSEL
jgi:hypothetical protein